MIYTRAAVATGAWVKSKHDVSDTWKCGSLSFIFTHPPEDLKKKRKCAGKLFLKYFLFVSIILRFGKKLVYYILLLIYININSACMIYTICTTFILMH